uniref:Chromatin modification-related protein MEAF6 n=1 Tax=Panagrolaimus sp. ES5 TaxID=591445 RepID=A0AC34FUB5_9BILA
MFPRITPCRRKRDGTRIVPPTSQSSKGSNAYNRLLAEVAKNTENRRKIEDQIYKFETHYLEEASKISYIAKAVRTSSRSLEAIDADRMARRNHSVIKPRDRIFSRSSYTSPLYQTGGPLHHEYLSLFEKTEPTIPEDPTTVRADSPDFSILDLGQSGNPRQTNRKKSAFDTSSEEEEDDQDGNESVMDDASEAGGIHEDEDNFDDDGIIDDDNEDSQGAYSPMPRRMSSMSRIRMSSGSLSPSLISHRRRTTATDMDFPIRARKGSTNKIFNKRRRQ